MVLWGQNAQGVNFASLGNVSYTFTGGKIIVLEQVTIQQLRWTTNII